MDKWGIMLWVFVMLAYLFFFVGVYQIIEEGKVEEKKGSNHIIKLVYSYKGVINSNSVDYDIVIDKDGTFKKRIFFGLETIKKERKLSDEELKRLNEISIKSITAKNSYGCEKKCNQKTHINFKVRLNENELVEKNITICCGVNPSELEELIDYIEKLQKFE